MKFSRLGEFEELVLLTIGALDDQAYSVSIKNEIQAHTQRSPGIGALHSALSRLEKKGFVSSHEGGATKERGGRRKRYYRITGEGKEALIAIHTIRNQLFARIPGLSGFSGLSFG